MSKTINLKKKIESINKIYRMSEAMQIVASASLRKIQGRQQAAKHFREHYERLVNNLGVMPPRRHAKVKPIVLAYVFASERGFCGSFNEKLYRLLIDFCKVQEAKGKEVNLVILGTRGCNFFHRHFSKRVSKWIRTIDKLTFEEFSVNSDEAFDFFHDGEVESIYVFYNSFKSMLVQEAVAKQVLPFDFSRIQRFSHQYLIEPSRQLIRRELCVNYLKSVFYDAFMQSLLGESASRLLTMRGATESSKKLIGKLTIELNKSRQAMITYELSEIISSFEILNEGVG